MDDKNLFELQRQQISSLKAEKKAILDALDMTMKLGSCSFFSKVRPSKAELLQEICAQASKIISFKKIVIYCEDTDTQELVQKFSYPENTKDTEDGKLSDLIDEKTSVFSLAEPISFFDSADGNHILLYSMVAPFQSRGIFAGTLSQPKKYISDIMLKSFSILMISAVNALESLEMFSLMLNHKHELEQKVQQRTQELKDAYDRLNVTINGMQAGVVVLEASTHKIVDANPVAQNMLGFDLDELVGRECFDLICTAQRGKCPIMDCGLDENSGECLIERADGTKVPVQKTVSKIMIGGKLHLVENFIDITEQKKLEALRDDVDRIMRHDLKGPLNGIIGLPQLLLMDRDKLTKDQCEIIEHIQDSGYKLLNMINFSLDLYRMETGVYDYTPAPADLATIVRSVFKDLTEQAIVKHLELRFLLNGSPVNGQFSLSIMTEELLVYSLLSNLLKNAVEASPQDSSVILDVLTSGDSTTLHIQNQGAVPENIRKSFFEKYVTEGKYEGTGLGTYSAKLIAETMGGNISMSTSNEEGTAVYVNLPFKVFV
ncbi:ATP-binding protein [Maridesulfovibrio zosterae]|uniref:ATP-binding protein n=1 Tax=Maridesulfovibrio zosterae TaxID=82171 RepID=UPI00041F52F0|nr:ATP-binding protein [Maridesulfovibrio zosterae]